MQDQKQSWEERFEKMTPKYSEINAPSKTKWLGDNPDEHLFYNYTYPESQFELSKEKVKQFISQEIQKATDEADKKAREEERDKIAKNIIVVSVNSFISDYMIETSISTTPLVKDNEKRLKYLITEELCRSGLINITNEKTENGINYTASINIINK